MGRRKSRGKPREEPTSRRAALSALVAVEKGRSRRLRDVLDLEGLAARDRDLAWELAQGTERSHLFLDLVLRQFVTRSLPEAPLLRSVLRLGAYQLLFSSRIPARAAVHSTVDLVRDKRGFVNAVLRQVADHVTPRAAAANAPRREIPLPEGLDGPRCLVFDGNVLAEPGTAGFLAARYGLPVTAVRRWVDAHGLEGATQASAASMVRPALFLRASHRVAEGSLADRLAAEGVAVEPFGPVFRVVVGAPFETRAFREGLFVAQGPTAYAAARAVDARPGETVLDLCAAPGTKTTVLAEAVGAGGRVFAWDVHRSKIDTIRENAARLGLVDRIVYPESPDVTVDRVLVDVPCSNTGVLARRVEARRRLSERAVRDLAGVQRGCLARALAACRTGGVVVYSTCSIEPEENRAVVESALGPGCELVEERLTLPDPDGGDGGYFAVLRRKGG